MFSNRREKRYQILYFGIGSLILLVIGFSIWHAHQQQVQQINHRYINASTPTLFVHGWSGTLRSEHRVVNAAESSGAASRRMIIRVSATGNVHIVGTVKKWMRNPIIMVKMANNRAGEFQYAHWITKICKILKRRYHVNRLNFIGHSMGAYAVVYYNLLNGNRSDLPRVNKLCLIAGPYDGIMDLHRANQPTLGPLVKLWDDAPNENRILPTGQPAIIHPEYRRLYRLRNRFPRQAKVLNIYGNIGDGSNSDGVVTNVSALSLGYLLRGRVTSYQTFETFGMKAQHSELHQHNLAVDRELIHFLWGKQHQDSSLSELN